MSRFTEWSQRAATNPTLLSKPDSPLATMSIMLAPLRITRYPIEIAVGERSADITIHRAVIHYPEPFDGAYLSIECRRFLYDAACAAVDFDHHLRWIIWADRSLTSCNPIQGRRRSPRFL